MDMMRLAPEFLPEDYVAPCQEEDVAELTLLLPASQVAEMERVAHTQGLTVGQVLRVLIRDCLASHCAPVS